VTPFTSKVYNLNVQSYQDKTPSKTRVDAPGDLHHIIVRGIGRAMIFKDDTDRNDFPDRIGAAGKGLFTLIICLENLP